MTPQVQAGIGKGLGQFSITGTAQFVATAIKALKQAAFTGPIIAGVSNPDPALAESIPGGFEGRHEHLRRHGRPGRPRRPAHECHHREVRRRHRHGRQRHRRLPGRHGLRAGSRRRHRRSRRPDGHDRTELDAAARSSSPSVPASPSSAARSPWPSRPTCARRRSSSPRWTPPARAATSRSSAPPADPPARAPFGDLFPQSPSGALVVPDTASWPSGFPTGDTRGSAPDLPAAGPRQRRRVRGARADPRRHLPQQRCGELRHPGDGAARRLHLRLPPPGQAAASRCRSCPSRSSIGTKLGFWPAAAISIAICALVGLLIYVVVFRPLARGAAGGQGRRVDRSPGGLHRACSRCGSAAPAIPVKPILPTGVVDARRRPDHAATGSGSP